jgi:cell division septation protein DedD
MKNKDFREIQVSSSLLVAIFLGVLALGVFIFLLGVSVGKKQVRLSGPTQVVTQQIQEPVKEPTVKPTVEETENDSPAPASSLASSSVPPSTKTSADELASKSSPPASSVKAPAPKPATEIPKTSAAAKGLWYVQVLSTDSKAKAQAAADRYKKQGLSAMILSPQAGEKLYKVRLGGFSSKTQAVDLKNRINAAEGGNKDYWVVKY